MCCESARLATTPRHHCGNSKVCKDCQSCLIPNLAANEDTAVAFFRDIDFSDKLHRIIRFELNRSQRQPAFSRDLRFLLGGFSVPSYPKVF